MIVHIHACPTWFQPVFKLPHIPNPTPSPPHLPCPPLSLLPRRQQQIHIRHNHRKPVLRFVQQLASILSRSERDVKRHYQSRYHGSQLHVRERFADTTPKPKRKWDERGFILDQFGTTVPALGDEFNGSDVGFWCCFGCQ